MSTSGLGLPHCGMLTPPPPLLRFSTVSVGLSFRRWLAARFRVPLPLFFGRWGLPLPYQRPITVVFGAPLDLGHVPDPSPDQVEAAYLAYVDALKRLFDEQVRKQVPGYAHRRLEIR